jgi:flagella basal body P-ring formation protein FlgA
MKRLHAGLSAELMALALALAFGSSASAASVALRDHADVAGEHVRLGDLAELDGESAKWADVDVWPAPPPCQIVRAGRAAVAQRLRDLAALRTALFDLVGAEQITIERRCQHLDPALLNASGREALAAWLRPRAEQFELAPIDLPMLELPVGEVSLVSRALPPNESVSARMHVWVDVCIDGRPIRAVPVAFSVHAYRDAWVASHDVGIGQRLEGAGLQHRRIDIAPERAEPLPELPRDARLRKPLLAGQALTTAHVEQVPPVVRGSTVTLKSGMGTIGVEARAEALQDGRQGQWVWVRVASATGPVRARVVDAGVVEVKDD